MFSRYPFEFSFLVKLPISYLNWHVYIYNHSNSVVKYYFTCLCKLLITCWVFFLSSSHFSSSLALLSENYGGSHNRLSTTGNIPPGHLLLLLYGSAQQYFEDGWQVNRGLVKKPEGLERLRYVKKKKKTRVENSPDDYFAEMNLQRMTAGVEWKK